MNAACISGPQEMAVVRGAKKGNGQERPWKCCDRAVPGPTTHGKVVWYCMDKVEHCTCKECMKLEGSHRPTATTASTDTKAATPGQAAPMRDVDRVEDEELETSSTAMAAASSSLVEASKS